MVGSGSRCRSVLSGLFESLGGGRRKGRGRGGHSFAVHELCRIVVFVRISAA